MGTKISEIIIAINAQGADAAVAEINKIKKSQDSLGKSAGNVGSETTKGLGGGVKALAGFGQSWAGVMSTITTIGIPAAATIAAIKKGLEFSKEGAQIKRLEETSTALASSMGLSMTGIMESLREASQGMVSDFDLMSSASKAMMLGVGTDAEQMGQLLEIAGIRGRAMGLSTTQAFDQMVTGIGRLSPMILDNLGIIIDADTTYSTYAASIGKSADELTRAEKTQALLSATIENTMPLVEQMGGLTRDLAGNWEYVGAQIKDFSDNLRKVAAIEDTAYDGATSYGWIEGVGVAFEGANLDLHNKELLHLAANIGLISEAERKWISMPVLTTYYERALAVDALKPAIEEYIRLVETGELTAKQAAEQVNYLYDTFGKDAFIDKTDSWTALNDQTSLFTQNNAKLTESLIMSSKTWEEFKYGMEEAGLELGALDMATFYAEKSMLLLGESITTSTKNLGELGTEGTKGIKAVALEMADLERQLADANLELDIQIRTYKEGLADELVAGLKSAGLEGEALLTALGHVDAALGTSAVNAELSAQSVERMVDLLVAGDWDAFASAVGEHLDMFFPLQESAEEAILKVEELQMKLESVEGLYKVLLVAELDTSDIDDWEPPTLTGIVNYNIGTLTGIPGQNIAVPQAIGGAVYPNQTYLWQEPGREGELLLPEKYGRVLSATEVGALLRESATTNTHTEQTVVNNYYTINQNLDVNNEIDIMRLTKKVVEAIAG